MLKVIHIRSESVAGTVEQSVDVAVVDILASYARHVIARALTYVIHHHQRHHHQQQQPELRNLPLTHAGSNLSADRKSCLPRHRQENTGTFWLICRSDFVDGRLV